MEQRAELRLLLNKALRTDADFEAFCHDHFHDIFQRFSTGMDRVQKTTLLLAIADHDQLAKLLSELLPTTVSNGAASPVSSQFRQFMPLIVVALVLIFMGVYRIIPSNSQSIAEPKSPHGSIHPDMAALPASDKILLYIDSKPRKAKVYRHASWGYDLLGPTPIRGYPLVRPRSGKVELKLMAAGRPDYHVVIDIPLSDKEIYKTIDLE